jgi:hypothetical protein
MDPVRWMRAPRSAQATRTDGVAVSLVSGHWVCRMAAKETRLKTPGLVAYLNKAVEEADELFPPAGWSVSGGVWASGTWCLRPVETGWGVFRTVKGQEERASRQVFESSDRARRWASLRLERGEAGLRGPKPRAGARAGAKLPDVRVTEEERVFAEETLDAICLSYSEFVRAALRWAKDNIGKEWSVTRDGDGVRFSRESP